MSYLPPMEQLPHRASAPMEQLQVLAVTLRASEAGGSSGLVPRLGFTGPSWGFWGVVYRRIYCGLRRLVLGLSLLGFIWGLMELIGAYWGL